MGDRDASRASSTCSTSPIVLRRQQVTQRGMSSGVTYFNIRAVMSIRPIRPTAEPIHPPTRSTCFQIGDVDSTPSTAALLPFAWLMSVSISLSMPAFLVVIKRSDTSNGEARRCEVLTFRLWESDRRFCPKDCTCFKMFDVIH